jgi:histidinol-phosphate aminotransferase
VIVDEAYLEYTPDFETRSAVSLVREGADVLVLRTFDKIHGLAGLPIGYSIVPRALGNALRKQGIGDAESLGRLNIAAASTALADQTHVQQVRSAVASERKKMGSDLGRSEADAHRLASQLHLFQCGSITGTSS